MMCVVYVQMAHILRRLFNCNCIFSPSDGGVVKNVAAQAVLGLFFFNMFKEFQRSTVAIFF